MPPRAGIVARQRRWAFGAGRWARRGMDGGARGKGIADEVTQLPAQVDAAQAVERAPAPSAQRLAPSAELLPSLPNHPQVRVGLDEQLPLRNGDRGEAVRCARIVERVRREDLERR